MNTQILSRQQLNVLHEHLQTRPRFKSPEWFQGLEARKLDEVSFHNTDRERVDQEVLRWQQETKIHANRKYYSVTRSSVEYVDHWLQRHAPGRIFLDYACGNGTRAVQAAKLGSSLAIGLDISDVSIMNAARDAAAAGVAERCRFVQGDCERTDFPDGSFDIILCCGMLHHLDLSRAFHELHRILASGGQIMAVEALGHNPLINLYRRLTPNLRTKWETEHIISMRDIDFAGTMFHVDELKFWHLLALGAVPLRKTSLFLPCLAFMESLDTVLLKCPLIQRMAWQVTFELTKK